MLIIKQLNNINSVIG